MNRPTMRDLRTPPWLTAGAVVMLTTGVVAIGDSPASGSAYAVVRRGTVTATATAAGSVRSADTRELVFGTFGTVQEVDVAPGTRVRTGQVLARLDDTAAREQVDVAEAQLTAAQQTYSDALQGVCKGSGGSGAGAGGAAGGANGGSAGTGSAGTGGATARPVGFRRPRPTRTPTPAPTSTSPAPTPTPSPTPTSPRPTPTAPAPTHTPRPTGHPTPTGRPKPSGHPKPSGKPKPSGHPRPGGRPGAGGGRPGGAKGGGGGAKGGGGGCPAGAAEQASAKVTQAEVSVRRAQRTLAATTLKAPMAGTVLSIAGTTGDQVGSGKGGFITLGDLSDLQVRALFSLGDVEQLRLGQQATIGLGMSATGRYSGTVTGIDPAATTSGNLARVGVNISLDAPPPGVLVGMSATVEVVTAQAQSVLYVPAGAVRPRPDGTATVLVRHDGQTITRTVRLGVRSDRDVTVTEGLSSGDHVVLPTGSGPDGFPDGSFPGV